MNRIFTSTPVFDNLSADGIRDILCEHYKLDVEYIKSLVCVLVHCGHGAAYHYMVKPTEGPLDHKHAMNTEWRRPERTEVEVWKLWNLMRCKQFQSLLYHYDNPLNEQVFEVDLDPDIGFFTPMYDFNKPKSNRERIAELELEVRVLRQWGNKDCTTMADQRLEEIRNGDPE